jgi:probable HAF family extracellular repeat protein
MRRPALVLTSLMFLVLATACNDSSVQPSLQSPAISSALEVASPMATVSRIDLGTLGGTRSYATDVNDWGIVVGWSENAAGVERAFRWTLAQGMTDLGTLPGDGWSRAISITRTGEVFGVSGRLGDNVGTPLVWTPSGNATSLPIPMLPDGARKLLATRNVLGQVIGTELGLNFFTHAWVWSASAGIHDIEPDIPGSFGESYGHDINARGLALGTFRARVCTGETHSAECWHTFLWNSSTGEARDIGIPSGDNLGRTQVTGAALNELGAVVGWTNFHGASFSIEPYLWTDRTGFTVLPTFPRDVPFAQYGYATSVNLVSTVVGASETQLERIQAAAWPPAGGIVRLSPDDQNPSVAVAVNLLGVVVGWSSLDCCGFTGTHATLWKLGPGRGVSPQPLTNLSSSVVSTATAASDPPSGPIGCLSDRNAVMSRQHLIDCVVRRRK